MAAETVGSEGRKMNFEHPLRRRIFEGDIALERTVEEGKKTSHT
jgi:hypothetical protein